jgi:hypothetical protein
MENVGIFYVHLVYFTAIGIFCGHLVYFFRFGALCTIKIWQPWLHNRCQCQCLACRKRKKRTYFDKHS